MKSSIAKRIARSVFPPAAPQQGLTRLGAIQRGIGQVSQVLEHAWLK
jgi:hypothetical protein